MKPVMGMPLYLFARHKINTKIRCGCDGVAVVPDVQVVHEHEMHAGKLPDKNPASCVAEGDGGARSRRVLNEGGVFTAHVRCPIVRARGAGLCPPARRRAAAVNAPGEHLAGVKSNGDGAVELLQFRGRPSAHRGHNGVWSGS